MARQNARWQDRDRAALSWIKAGAHMDFYRLFGPPLRRIEAEAAHRLAVAALRAGLVPCAPDPDTRLERTVFGVRTPNPVGLAAGFDKNAEAIGALLDLGFGFVEVGTVTPRPQAGNPRPRLFRLPRAQAVVNRMGFNNDGMAAVATRLTRFRDRGRPGIVGVNIGPNRDSDDREADVATLVAAFAPLADYLVVNVSSPNTPGLRDLQQADALARLMARALEARRGARPPILVKVSPDLTADERAAIASLALEMRFDGLIATNTTTARTAGLVDPAAREAGGLSGAPLFEPSTEALRDFHRLTGGAIPLIGVGGIASPEDAVAKFAAGASLIQIYTALVYQGPALIGRILARLAADARATAETVP